MKRALKYIVVFIICLLCITAVVAYCYRETIEDFFIPKPTESYTVETTKSAPAPKKTKSNTKSKKNKSKHRSKKTFKSKTIITYILNTHTHHFHYKDCIYANTIAEHNAEIFKGSRDEIIDMGFEPCQVCSP